MKTQLTSQMIRDYARANNLMIVPGGSHPPGLSVGNVLQHMIRGHWNPLLDWWQLTKEVMEQFGMTFEDWSQLEIGSEYPDSPWADHNNLYYQIGRDFP